MLWIRPPCHFKSCFMCFRRMWQDAFLGDAAQQKLLLFLETLQYGVGGGWGVGRSSYPVSAPCLLSNF